MTLEAALMTAIASVTGALVIVAKLLWKRSEDCESDRLYLREQIEEVKQIAGEHKGRVIAYEMCPTQTCPFKGERHHAKLENHT